MTNGQIPRIVAPLKARGITIGSITIEPDGSFTGRLGDTNMHLAMAQIMREGLADGVLLTANTVPASPLEPTDPVEQHTEKVLSEKDLRNRAKKAAHQILDLEAAGDPHNRLGQLMNNWDDFRYSLDPAQMAIATEAYYEAGGI